MGNQQLFKDMLKSRRKGMGAANRSKTKHPNTNKNVWLYPYHFERKYAKDIGIIQKLFTVPLTKAINDNLDRWITDFNSDGTTFKKDIFGEELVELIASEQVRLNEIYGGDAPRVRAMITATGIDVSDFNGKQSQKFFKDILGVEFFITEPWETEVIEVWSQTNFKLIESLSTEYIKGVNTIVSEGVQFGKTSNAIMKEIQKHNVNITGARSRLIARDQVGKLNGALTKRRMEDAGIDMYTWMTANDERVRSKHKTLNNKLMRWDNPNVYSIDKGKTWKNRTGDMYKGIPGQDIQCFLGNTKVTSPVPTQKLYRRGYTGKATIFTLNNGSTFTCTLNHPILTGSGTMYPAHLLNVGQDLVSISPDGRFPLLESDQKNTIPTIKELFDFSSIIGFKSTTSTIGSDFHGDGIVDEKVDIVSLEDKLPVNFESIINKKLIEEFFTKANMELSCMFTNSRMHLMFHSLGFTPSSFVSFLCNLLSLRESILTESNEISSRTISKFNSLLNQSTGNNSTRDIIFFGQEENTFSREVLTNDLFYRNLFLIGRVSFMMNNRISHSSKFLREIVGMNTKGLTKISQVHSGNIPIVHIVKKRIIELSVHVYNLQNSNSWYTITDSGIIVNNCRCSSSPFFDDIIEEVDTEIKDE